MPLTKGLPTSTRKSGLQGNSSPSGLGCRRQASTTRSAGRGRETLPDDTMNPNSDLSNEVLLWGKRILAMCAEAKEL